MRNVKAIPGFIPREYRAKSSAVRGFSLPQIYYLTWFLCFVFVLQYVVKADDLYKTICGVGITGLCFFLTLKKPVYAICLIPITALMGPIRRWELSGASINLGDLVLVAVLIGYLISGRFKKKFWLGPYSKVSCIMLFFICASWILSVDPVSSAVAVVGILQLIAVYLLTINLIETQEDLRQLLYATILAVTVSGALVIYSFLIDEPLLIGMSDTVASNYALLRHLRPEDFSSASFFVTGFIFPLSAISVITFAYLLNSSELSTIGKLIFFGAFPITIGTLVVMGNKTAIISAVLVFVALLITQNYSRKFFSRMISILGVCLMLTIFSCAAFYLISPATIEGIQLRFVAKFSDATSFLVRLTVWERVVRFMAESPGSFVFGLGPDISIRNATDEQIMSLFTVDTGTEGAVDSGYLYVLLNYGTVVFSLFLYIFFSTLRGLWRLKDQVNNDASKLMIRAIQYAILAWLIMGVTQQHGVSKPVYIIIQLVAVAHLLIAERLRPGKTA